MSAEPTTILMNLMVSEAYAKFYIQWKGEDVSEQPAFLLFEDWSPFADKNSWTLRMWDITSWVFSSENKAKQFMKEFFLTRSKEPHGKLLIEFQSGRRKVFVEK